MLKVTASSCPADPRADGDAAAAGGASLGTSRTDTRRTDTSRTDTSRTDTSRTDTSRAGAGGTGAGGAAARDAGATALAASPATLARPVIEGQALFYDPGQAAGSCGLGPFPAGGWYASLPPRSYASGRACGSYLDVNGPRGTVRAEVVDVCADCAAGTVNLSRAAFARIADPRTGMVAVIYRTALDPPLPGPLILRISGAARPGALAVQVINHGNRLSSVAASWPAAGGSGSRRARTATGSGRCARGGPGRVRRRAGPRVPASGSGSPMWPAIRWCSAGYRTGAPCCTPPHGCTGAGDWRAPRPLPSRLPRRRGRAATPGRPGPRPAADQARDQRPGRPGIACPEPCGPLRTAPPRPRSSHGRHDGRPRPGIS